MGNISYMSKKQTYFGYTTKQQRKRLFEEWEATGSVTKACQKAHVSRGLFYYWKPRFEQEGYDGLEEFNSRAPHKPKHKGETVTQEVIAMRQANPDWGKKRISQEMAKANNWEAVVSPNTVKRILGEAGLWSKSDLGKKKESPNERTNR